MCTSGRLWSRALVGALLIVLAASLEVYDQPPASEDLFYQDGNDIDTGPGEEPPQGPLPRVSDVMLRRLIHALQLQDAAERLSYRQTKLPYDAEHQQRHLERPREEAEPKGSVYKRLAEVYGGHHLYKTGRPQQKWKIKKGKAIGSQMVCYFKLCAFRSPA